MPGRLNHLALGRTCLPHPTSSRLRHSPPAKRYSIPSGLSAGSAPGDEGGRIGPNSPVEEWLKRDGCGCAGGRARSLSTSAAAAKSMSAHKNFPEANEKYVSELFTEKKAGLPIAPGRKLAVVTCMDARIDPLRHLGLEIGDAHIIRNAGGVAREAIRSIVISQRLLGTREIAIFHHTNCGMTTFTTPQLREQVHAESGARPGVAEAVDNIDFLEFPTSEEAVAADAKWLKEHPLVLPGTGVTGWIYEVETGKIKQIY